MANELASYETDDTDDSNGSDEPGDDANGAIVEFEDANLEAAIRAQLDIDTAPITRGDMAGLTLLNAQERTIHSTEGLEHATNLETLLAHGNEITTLGPLADLTALSTLDLADTHIDDLSPLTNATALNSVNLSGNEIGDLGPLADLTALAEVDLSDNQIDDLAPLAGLGNLTCLDLKHNEISDISPLTNLSGLAELFVQGNQIADLDPLMGLTNLNQLNASTNPVEDLAPLADLTSLEWLHVAENQLDISAGSTTMTIVEDLLAQGVEILYEPQNAVPSGPAITHLDPDVLTGSNELQSLTIHGSGFDVDATVAIHDLTTGLVISDPEILDRSSTHVTFESIFSASDEPWGVEVINADGAAVREDESIVVAGTLGPIFDVIGLPPGPYVDVAIGGNGMIALHQDGTIHAMSTGTSGIPGAFDIEDVPTGSDFTSVAMSNAHAMALREDGRIETWGADSHWIEQNTPGASVTHAPTDAAFIQIDAGQHHGIALHEGGDVVTWGMGTAAGSPPSDGPFAMVAAGDSHSLAIHGEPDDPGAPDDPPDDPPVDPPDDPPATQTVALGPDAARFLRYTDDAGTQVTIRLTGGEGEASFAEEVVVTEAGAGLVVDTPVSVAQINLTNTTTRDVLVIAGRGGDGVVEIGSIMRVFGCRGFHSRPRGLNVADPYRG